MIIQYFIHYLRVGSQVLYRALTHIIPLSEDERSARSVSPASVSVRQLKKSGAAVIVMMSIDDAPVRALIHTLKYHGSVVSAKRIAQLLAAEVNAICIREHIDYIIPVPLSAHRFRERGFNQVTYACECMAHYEPAIGVRISTAPLRRNKNTHPQTNLNKSERTKNVSGAFTCTTSVSGKRILLIDDVVTTGATLLSAKHALTSSGATSVTLCAFAGR